MNKRRELQKLQKELTAHFEKIYAPEGKVFVFGDGEPDAPVMLIGEAPGEQETLQQRPFVGKAGKNLDEFLALAGLPRESVYISNAVKFRPVKVSEKGRVSNRTPNTEELMLFTPWLMKEIELVSPKVLVTLGNVPLRAVTQSRATIGQAHGKIWPEEICGAKLFPLYHPASIIYNRSLAETYKADVMALGEYIGQL